jgi:murein DD-endopeptidase MepM/ murein hydrolase activator NlpD
MRSTILFLFVLTALAGRAQRAVEISYTQDNAGHYFYTATNKAFCPYYIRIDFPVLDNLNADHPLPYDVELKPGPTKILTLSPIDKAKDTKVKYTVQTHKGQMHPTVNPNFTYLLPTGPAIETQAYRIPNTAVNSTFPGHQDSGYSVRLRAKPGDTIYAARRGVVSEIDVHNTENDAGATSTNGWNYVEVYHADGSFAEYGVVKKDGALVKPGQLVEAGTPVGIVGGDQYGRGSEIRFSVSYYPGVQNTQIPLQIWTKANGKGPLKQGAFYTGEFTKTLLTAETKGGGGKTGGAKAPAKKAAGH